MFYITLPLVGGIVSGVLHNTVIGGGGGVVSGVLHNTVIRLRHIICLSSVIGIHTVQVAL